MHSDAFDLHPAQQHQHRHIRQRLVTLLAFEDIVGLHRLERLGERDAVFLACLHARGRAGPRPMLKINLCPTHAKDFAYS